MPRGYTVTMNKLILALGLAFLCLGSPARAAACPSCRDALATAESKDGTPQGGFSWQGEAVSLSVLFMLAVPFTLMGGFGIAFYRLSRPLKGAATEANAVPVTAEAIPS